MIEGAVVSAADGAWENVVDGIKYRSEKQPQSVSGYIYIYTYVYTYIYIVSGHIHIQWYGDTHIAAPKAV